MIETFVSRAFLLMLSMLPVLVRPVRADDLEKLKELVREKFADVKSISAPDLAKWLADTNRAAPLIVDVRSEEEFEISGLKGARRFERVEDMPKLSSSNAPVVVYCSVGYRSAEFARKLQRQGFTNVWNLEGSIFDWANQGYPVYRGTNQVHQVHPYSRKWGGLLKPELRAARPNASNRE
jgi:rhodanese-related sulfurtransferase